MGRSNRLDEGLPLNEFTKEEWWGVAKLVKPDITWPEYEVMWADAVKTKAKYLKNKQLH